MNTYAIPALKEKRAQIAGRVISLKKQISRHHKELANLDATISLFEPSYKIGSIKPIRKQRRSKLFKLGELGRLIMDVMRPSEGQPMATRDIVAGVSLAIGQGKNSEAVLAATVRSNLAYMARRGKVVQVGNGVGCKWAFPVPLD
ncbi:MAG: hypothetical protein ABJA10_04485 [Aestuariivirga sp.]